MPATVADIGLATRGEYAFDTQESATIKGRHLGARDTADKPRVSWLDSVSNAGVVNAAAFALVGTERRRFAVPVDGLVGVGAGKTLDPSSTTPAVEFVDAELAADLDALVVRVELDLGAERTNLEILG